MMKVLGICASARKNGNTAIMMRKVFEALEKEGIETELVQFAGTVIEPCKACWACAGRGNCVHKNDCFREVFEKMKEADGVLLAPRPIPPMYPPTCRHSSKERPSSAT